MSFMLKGYLIGLEPYPVELPLDRGCPPVLSTMVLMPAGAAHDISSSRLLSVELALVQLRGGQHTSPGGCGISPSLSRPATADVCRGPSVEPPEEVGREQ